MIKDILQTVVKTVIGGFSKQNLNPVQTPSTGIAYTAPVAMAALHANPQSEQDYIIQLALAVIGVYFFYKKPNSL